MARTSQRPARVQKLAGVYEVSIASDSCGLFADIVGIKGVIEAEDLDTLLRRVAKEIARQDHVDAKEVER